MPVGLDFDNGCDSEPGSVMIHIPSLYFDILVDTLRDGERAIITVMVRHLNFVMSLIELWMLMSTIMKREGLQA